MTKKIWFKARSYGWGWQPATKEGWGVMALWLLAVIITAYLIDVSSSVMAAGVFVVLMFAYTSALLFVSWKKGERPVWKWRGEEVPPHIAFTHTFGLLSFVAIAECAGALGAFFTVHAIPDWYIFLNKPSFSPPNWLFGPVWIVLYLVMGTAAYLIWIRASSALRTRAIGAYFIQLGLNTLWTPVFFGLKNPILGMVVIASLWVMIVVTIYRFAKLDRIAAMLLIPYLIWVSFASILNIAIVILN